MTASPKTAKGRNKARLFVRAAAPPRLELTSRDYEVLSALAEHRVLSAEHLRRLVFRSAASKVRRRLRALYDHRLIDRVKLVSAPTQDIPPFLYSLDRDGVALVARSDALRAPTRLRYGSMQFLHHRHLVNEFFVTLIEALQAGGSTLIQWRHEEALRLPTADGLPGRPERVPHAQLGSVSFLPDGYFELQNRAGKRFAYFLEIDRATHPQRVWRQRAQLYLTYADPRRGLFRQRFGRDTFRLCVVTTRDFRRRSRRDNILRTLRASVGPSDLFLATTFDEIEPSRLLGPIWHRADNGSPCSIVQNPAIVVRAGSSPMP